MAEPLEPPKRQKRQVSKLAVEAGQQSFIPQLPVNANDLIGSWDLPAEAINGAALKITRLVPMTRSYEVIRVSTVREYRLDSIARDFGPGEYYLQLSPGPGGAWSSRRTSITVSENYARECGFSALLPEVALPAPPRISEMRSLQESSRAIQSGGNFSPEMLFQIMETMADRIEAKLSAKIVQPVPDQNKGLMDTWIFLQNMQKNSMDQAMALAGLRGNATSEPEEEVNPWAGIIKEALPAVLQVAGSIFNRQPQQEAQSQHPIEVNPEVKPMPQQIKIPLSQEEVNSLSGAVGLLRPFSSHVLKILESKQSGFEASAELADFIPGALEPDMIRFCDLAEARGKDVLALIHPALATPKGLECVVGIGKILKGGEE